MKRLVLLLAITSVPAFAGAQQRSLTMTASPGYLTIANVTRGGRAILAGISFQAEGGGVRRLRRFAEVLSDADADGQIVYVPDGKVPRRSVWAVIDLDTGGSATAGGPELSAFLKPFPDTALKRDVDDLIAAFASAAVQVELVVVRPKDGAWHAHAHEGREGDADGILNGTVTMPFASATPLVAEFGKAPKQLRKDDVVVLIDIRRLRLATTTIVK